MNKPIDESSPWRALWSRHARRWQGFDYVYPVMSRRSRGLSIGINLNPDKRCNWDCVYCQVDRTTPATRKDVDLDQLSDELDGLLRWAMEGEIWRHEPLDSVPAEARRIADIAFSGDGEPTTYARFDEACRIAAEQKAHHRMTDVKIVVLSNMTMCERPAVKRGFEVLDQNNGEIWAKLDAGTEPYYRAVDRSRIPFSTVLDNILAAGRIRPLVIQSLLMSWQDRPISDTEFEAYLARLALLLDGGCQLRRVQLYTIARRTTERSARPLDNRQLDDLARRFRSALPAVPCEVFYGVDAQAE